jgi:hypothetical protein
MRGFTLALPLILNAIHDVTGAVIETSGFQLPPTPTVELKKREYPNFHAGPSLPQHHISNTSATTTSADDILDVNGFLSVLNDESIYLLNQVFSNASPNGSAAARFPVDVLDSLMDSMTPVGINGLCKLLPIIKASGYPLRTWYAAWNLNGSIANVNNYRVAAIPTQATPTILTTAIILTMTDQTTPYFLTTTLVIDKHPQATPSAPSVTIILPLPPKTTPNTPANTIVIGKPPKAIPAIPTTDIVLGQPLQPMPSIVTTTVYGKNPFPLWMNSSSNNLPSLRNSSSNNLPSLRNSSSDNFPSGMKLSSTNKVITPPRPTTYYKLKEGWCLYGDDEAYFNLCEELVDRHFSWKDNPIEKRSLTQKMSCISREDSSLRFKEGSANDKCCIFWKQDLPGNTTYGQLLTREVS